ncbi:MAG: sulfite exporter TauE/SafE family protein [Roseibacillus sp.]|jgi:uncharacterized membrane protein YfcA
MDFELSSVEWTWAIVAALAVGVSKTGFGGIGLLAVSIMVDLFGKPSVGILLPMLILADISVYPLFRKYASWAPVWKLLPPTLLGCTAGYFFLEWIPDENSARSVIGGIILVMVTLQLFRRFSKEWFERVAHSREAGVAAGFAAGTATMVANAAGPVFQLYLLSRRFEKMELIGVGARFFLLINILKLPVLGGLDFINSESLLFNAKLAPVILLGILIGRRFVHAVSQRVFEWLVIIFAIIAGGRLVFF